MEKKLQIKPDKSLGQNFIFNETILERISTSIFSDGNTAIVEIGTGYANLTKFLAQRNCRKVLSIEKDENLYNWVNANIILNNVCFQLGDALTFNWENFAVENSGSKIIVTGNLPYYISNSLIIDLLLKKEIFFEFFFLIQKEVAEKLLSTPKLFSKKYSALSVFVSCLANLKYLFEISRNDFSPVPEVDGVFLQIKPLPKLDFNKETSLEFLAFLKNCFRFRRKTLWNNLNSFAGNFSSIWKCFFEKNDFSQKIRPQEIEAKIYLKLFLFWKKMIREKNLEEKKS